MGRLFRLVFWLAGAWALGLMIFISTVPAADENQARFSNTDLSNPGNVGVVAYTGGRGTRIAEAMRLFQRGIGTRMLISGVHPDTTANDLKKLWNGDPLRFGCCIDLGPQAQTTKGNAEELMIWAREHKMDTVILVTSDYHLPRAIAETRNLIKNTNALGEQISIIPWSAPSPHIKPGGFATSWESWKTLSLEYSKFLMARLDHWTRPFTNTLQSKADG